MPSVDDYLIEELHFIEENELRVGDYVRVIRESEPDERGWRNIWNDEMLNTIGDVLQIEEFDSERRGYGIKLENGWWYPYFVLSREVDEDIHLICLDNFPSRDITTEEYRVLMHIFYRR